MPLDAPNFTYLHDSREFSRLVNKIRRGHETKSIPLKENHLP